MEGGLAAVIAVACVTSVSGLAQPGKQLQADLNAAINAGRSTFAIAEGTYQFNHIDLLVDTARDMAITAEGGVALYFSCNWGVVLRSCMNVTLHNVTIDYDPPCFSQGRVTALREGAVEYSVDDNFPTPDSDPRFDALRVKIINWNPTTQVKISTRLMNQTFGIHRLANRTYEVGADDATRAFEVGQAVTIGPRVGHTILLTNCTRCGVIGVTLYGSSDMALVEYGGGGANVWRGNRVIRNTARQPLGLLVSNADGFQSTGCERGPLFENNELSYAGDDCANLHNYFNVVIQRDPADAKRVLLLDGVGEGDLTGEGYPWHQQLNNFANVREGDVARVYESTGNFRQRLTTSLMAFKEVAIVDGASCSTLANATLEAVGIGPGSVRRNWVGVVKCYWAAFADAMPVDIGPHAYVNLDQLSSAGAIVRGNHFHHCGHVHFKSIGGEVSGNYFRSTKGIGIDIMQQWLEGSIGLRDVLVSRNHFADGLGQSNIDVGKRTSNITVRDNYPPL